MLEIMCCRRCALSLAHHLSHSHITSLAPTSPVSLPLVQHTLPVLVRDERLVYTRDHVLQKVRSLAPTSPLSLPHHLSHSHITCLTPTSPLSLPHHLSHSHSCSTRSQSSSAMNGLSMLEIMCSPQNIHSVATSSSISFFSTSLRGRPVDVRVFSSISPLSLPHHLSHSHITSLTRTSPLSLPHHLSHSHSCSTRSQSSSAMNGLSMLEIMCSPQNIHSVATSSSISFFSTSLRGRPVDVRVFSSISPLSLPHHLSHSHITSLTRTSPLSLPHHLSHSHSCSTRSQSSSAMNGLSMLEIMCSPQNIHSVATSSSISFFSTSLRGRPVDVRVFSSISPLSYPHHLSHSHITSLAPTSPLSLPHHLSHSHITSLTPTSPLSLPHHLSHSHITSLARTSPLSLPHHLSRSHITSLTPTRAARAPSPRPL
ncbi:hypothetical protein O0L34_g17943 [Tuta absoluta]|nr:hypothetical protein O0L34_g17943 [Tuta absoluta]